MLIRARGSRVGASSPAQVAVCNAHNKYEQDFAALQADPARLQEAKNKAKKHNKQLNPFKKRMPDPTVKQDLKDGLPDGEVDVPESYRSLFCGQITGCHTATVELLALTGVPETAEVNALGCFVVRTTETAILWAGNKNIQHDFNVHVFARFRHTFFTV